MTQTGQQHTGSGQTPPPPPPPAFTNQDVGEIDKDVLSFPISRTGRAQVRFNGRITQEAIQKLVAHLNLTLDVYPKEAELNQPKTAVWRNKDHDQPDSRD